MRVHSSILFCRQETNVVHMLGPLMCPSAQKQLEPSIVVLLNALNAKGTTQFNLLEASRNIHPLYSFSFTKIFRLRFTIQNLLEIFDLYLANACHKSILNIQKEVDTYFIIHLQYIYTIIIITSHKTCLRRNSSNWWYHCL